MSREERMQQHDTRADYLRWSWLLSLILIAAIVLAVGQPLSANAGGSHTHYVVKSLPADHDCDHDQDPVIGHCHASVSYAAFAPVDAGAIIVDVRSGRRALPASQPVLASWTLRPNLQPPQASTPA